LDEDRNKSRGPLRGYQSGELLAEKKAAGDFRKLKTAKRGVNPWGEYKLRPIAWE